MIASATVAVGLSVLFAVTAATALARWSASFAGALPAAHRLPVLAHLAKSAAMLLMTWTVAGAAGRWAQLALFGGFATWFATDTVRRRRGPGCAGGSSHALHAAAMVWMLAAMPLIMPVSAGPGGHEGHGGHGGHGTAVAAAAAAPTGGTAGWAVATTVVLGVVLLATAGFWTTRALAADPGGHPGGGAGPRADAVTHALMAVGTTVMLAAMVGGW